MVYLLRTIICEIENKCLSDAAQLCLQTFKTQSHIMKIIRILLCGILALALSTPARAQKYVTDDNFADSVSVYHITFSEDGKYEMLGKEALKLPMGETIIVERLLKGQTAYGLIKVDGKDYGINSSYLLFSYENPEGVEDIFGDTRDRINHSCVGKFFASFTPYAIIAFLFIGAMVFMFLGLKINGLRRYALFIVPGCILLASLLEVWAYWAVGNDAFWWCDKDRYGFFGSLLRAIPFMLFVAFQLFSFKFYQDLLLGKDSEAKLSIKPMAVSLIICVPVALAFAVILAICDIRGTFVDILTVVVFLVSLAAGVWMSMKKNIKLLGKTAGLAFTIFGIAYILGSLVAIWGLIIVLLRLIVQILIICAAIVGVGFAMGSGGSDSSSSGPAPGSTQWIDAEGGRHNSEWDAKAANKRIAERKANS